MKGQSVERKMVVIKLSGIPFAFSLGVVLRDIYSNLWYCDFSFQILFCRQLIQQNFDQKMACGCSGVVFGMFKLKKEILTNLNFWGRHQANLNYTFVIFVNSDVVLPVFTFSYSILRFIDLPYASHYFRVNNINFSTLRVNKIRLVNVL